MQWLFPSKALKPCSFQVVTSEVEVLSHICFIINFFMEQQVFDILK